MTAGALSICCDVDFAATEPCGQQRSAQRRHNSGNNETDHLDVVYGYPGESHRVLIAANGIWGRTTILTAALGRDALALGIMGFALRQIDDAA